MSQVAKLVNITVDELQTLHPHVDVVKDINNNKVIDESEALAHLSFSQYTMIDWAPAYIGSPRPRGHKN